MPRSRDGGGAEVRFFPTSMTGPDPASTFAFSERLLMTDAGVYYQLSKADGEEFKQDLLLLMTDAGVYYQLSEADGEEFKENLLLLITDTVIYY